VDRTSHRTRTKEEEEIPRQKHNCAKGGRVYTYNVRDVLTSVRSGLQVAGGTLPQHKHIYDKGLEYSTKEEITATWLAQKT
jgi:hypothetical protein